ncbi:hypothetical protein Ciccas_009071 [Cichlidogyrus casuarinus]|uniref:Uncharacterized protein n=1 Tax=Cichlidogyrus casuarinus TaxID=1844966 RepID=A0ABD2PYJ1_9PLAT
MGFQGGKSYKIRVHLSGEEVFETGPDTTIHIDFRSKTTANPNPEEEFETGEEWIPTETPREAGRNPVDNGTKMHMLMWCHNKREQLFILLCYLSLFSCKFTAGKVRNLQCSQKSEGSNVICSWMRPVNIIGNQRHYIILVDDAYNVMIRVTDEKKENYTHEFKNMGSSSFEGGKTYEIKVYLIGGSPSVIETGLETTIMYQFRSHTTVTPKVETTTEQDWVPDEEAEPSRKPGKKKKKMSQDCGSFFSLYQLY